MGLATHDSNTQGPKSNTGPPHPCRKQPGSSLRHLLRRAEPMGFQTPPCLGRFSFL